MADLGTVVGVVSLAFQVFEYVHTYVDALQGRKEDLESTIRHCETMQALLGQMKILQEKHPTSIQISSVAVKKAISATVTEMTLLQELIVKIAPDHPRPKSMAGRFDKQKQLMLYPFRRPHLDQLDERLAKANDALQSTLQLTVLEMATETGDILKDVQTVVDSSRVEINGKLDHLQGISQQGHNATSALYQETSLMRTELQHFIPQSTNQAQASLEMMQSIERNVAGSSSLISGTHHNTLALRESVDELTMMLKDLRSPTLGVLSQKLISKPSALKLIYDQECASQSDLLIPQLGETNLEGIYSSLLSCSCHRRRRLQRKRYQFGRAFLAQETFTDNAHSSGCPFFDLCQPQTRLSFGISVTMFRAAASVAMAFTMNSRSGAGGFGICPSFTYYPINQGSPVLRVFDVLTLAYLNTDSRSFSRILQKGLEVLRWTFKTGRASPFDRTKDGSSLLQEALAFGKSVGKSPEFSGVLLTLAKFLVAVGVSRDNENEKNLSWHQIVSLADLYGSSSLETLQRLFKICWIDDPSIVIDFPSNARRFGCVSPSSLSFHQMVYHNLGDQVEWLGNDLHLAVLRQDTARLLGILESRPKSALFCTPDVFGITALQMTVAWPEGLRIILDQIDNSVLQDHDEKHTPVIQCALSISRRNCSEDNTIRCSDSCSCTDAVALLLEAKCPIFICDISDSLLVATTRCQELIIYHLKKRREKLVELAMFNLHPRDIARFNLESPSVLDHYTVEVIAALDSRGVDIPRWLRTGRLWDCACLRNGEQQCAHSVYETLVAIPSDVTGLTVTLDRFYAAGFVDVDGVFDHGYTTALNVWRPDVFIWLVQHGIDLLTHRPLRAGFVTGYRTVHSWFCWRGVMLGALDRLQEKRQHKYLIQLTQILYGHPCEDCCVCGCSANGCHPWTMLWKGFYESSPISRPGETGIELWKHHRNTCLEAFEDFADAPAEVKAIALRTTTFDALQIRHTCCNSGRKNEDEEEFEEIREEDAVELERLEKLLVEFEEELERQGCSLGQFFRTYWDDRMIQVFREKDEQTITQENLAGAAELGVRLDCEETGPVSLYGSLYWQEPDYWIEKLDDLME